MMSEDGLKEDRAWALVITALSKFKQDIADGYFTRDRQYAIDMLGKAIEVRATCCTSSSPTNTTSNSPGAEKGRRDAKRISVQLDE